MAKLTNDHHLPHTTRIGALEMYHVFQNREVKLNTKSLNEARAMAASITDGGGAYDTLGGAMIYSSHSSANRLDEIAYYQNGHECSK